MRLPRFRCSAESCSLGFDSLTASLAPFPEGTAAEGDLIPLATLNAERRRSRRDSKIVFYLLCATFSEISENDCVCAPRGGSSREAGS